MGRLARYEVRPGTPLDGPGIMEVHRRSILAFGPAAYTEVEVESWVTGLTADIYDGGMTGPGRTFMVAIDKDAVVGFCSTKDDEVTGLFVDPDWARQGVGRDLLRRAEEDIVERGHDRFRVIASLTGQSFYEAHGYRVVRNKTWKTRGGLELAALAMEKQVGNDPNT